MIQEAEEFAETDRLQRERVEKRNRAEALTFQAERLLREVALDFGMQFARDRRRRIEGLVQELRGYLEQADERGIDIAQTELQDELYDLNREAYLYEADDEEGDLLGRIGDTLKKTFAFDDDLDPRPTYGYQGSSSWDNWDDDWDYDNRGGQQRYGEPPYRANAGYGQQPPYGDSSQANYPANPYPDRRYDDSGYNQPDYDRQGYDDRRSGGGQSYDDSLYTNRGYGSQGYNDPGYNDSGYGRQDYNNPGYNNLGNNNPGYNDSGYNQPDYGRQGYDDRSSGPQSPANRSYGNPPYDPPGPGRRDAGESQSGYGTGGPSQSNWPADDPAYRRQESRRRSAGAANGTGGGYPERRPGDDASRPPERRPAPEQPYDGYTEPPPTEPRDYGSDRPSPPDTLDDDPWTQPAAAPDRPGNNWRGSAPPRGGSTPPDSRRPPAADEDDRWGDKDEWF